MLIRPSEIYMANQQPDGLWNAGGDVIIEYGYERAPLADATALGRALRVVLDTSPIIPAPKKSPNFYREGIPEFNRDLARLFGLNGNRSPYAGMKGCEVERRLDEVTMYPMRKLHGSAWEGFKGLFRKGHEDVRVRYSADDEALELALQECLTRCL